MRSKGIAFVTALFLAALAFPMISPSAPGAADSWNRIGSGGFEAGFNDIQFEALSSAVYGGKLYVGTYNYTGCEVWRLDGSSWTRLVADGFGDSDNRGAYSMAVYDSGTGERLYVGTYKQTGGCDVWRYDGASWTQVVGQGGAGTPTGPGFGDTDNTTVKAMCVFGGKLYAGTIGSVAQVWALNGNTWAQDNNDGFGGVNPEYNDAVYSFATHAGQLYAGTYNVVNGCQVWRTSGGGPGDWAQANQTNFEAGNNNIAASSLASFGGSLYAGTLNSTDGCKVFRYDGPLPTDWTQVNVSGFGHGSREAPSMAGYNAKLYVGTWDSDGCELWSMDAGWTQEIGQGGAGTPTGPGFGDEFNRSVDFLLPADVGSGAELFAGTENYEHGGQVWRYGGAWSKANENGFAGNNNRDALCMAEFGGAVYAGTESRSTGGQVWRFNGSAWSQTNAGGFGDADNERISSLVAYNGYLYAGVGSSNSNCEVWRSADGSSWSVNVGPGGIIGPGFGIAGNIDAGSMAVYDGKLYAGTRNSGGCQVWRFDGSTWSNAATGGFGDIENSAAGCLAVYNGKLYAGTWNDNGCEVWRYDGATWSPVRTDGFGSGNNRGAASLAAYDGRLYVGTYNGSDGCEAWRYDGSAWEKVASGGFGDWQNEIVSSMSVLNGKLFAGLDHYVNNCRVWSYDGRYWSAASPVGFGDADNAAVSCLLASGQNIYAGTRNVGSGCQVWRAAAQAPVITSIDPTSGPNGSTVTVNGTEFGPGGEGSSVLFDSTAATCTSWKTYQIVCLVPEGVAGTVPVKVVTPVGSSNAWDFIATQPVWYLAEGSTNWGFNTFITIENPNVSTVNCDLVFMTPGGEVQGPTVQLPAASQATVNPAATLGANDFSTRVECREGGTIAVDRTMIWNAGLGEEGHSSVGVTAPATTWYLPEGSSNWGFETFLLIQNPSDGEAKCTVTYMIQGKGPATFEKIVGAGSRATFNMADDIGAEDASIMVTSDVPVIPERAMYRNGRREGHDSIGTTAAANDYYLAEGTTAWGFTTFVLVQNPNDGEAEVNITYQTPSGSQVQAPFVMPANSRQTIRVNDILPDADISTRVHGSQPIIAERAMYWDAGTGEACHDSVGMSSPHSDFYLPDGQTTEGRETFTLVQNPNAGDVRVEVAYLTETGENNQSFEDTVPGNSRRTYNMVDGGVNGRAAVRVRCLTDGSRIMVERAMYWNSRGAGTDTIGGYSD